MTSHLKKSSAFFSGKTKKQGQLCDAERSKETLLYSLQQFEQHALRGALIQERSHFCNFVNMMSLAWVSILSRDAHIRSALSVRFKHGFLGRLQLDKISNIFNLTYPLRKHSCHVLKNVA